MEFDAMVEAIARLVTERLERENGGKPRLLLLAQKPDAPCLALLDSSRLRARYRVERVAAEHGQVEMEDCAGVVLFDLTNEALGRVATGICGTPETELVSRALLLGKPVWLPREGVELFQYQATAAPRYYGRLRQDLTLLEQSGVILCAREGLEDQVLAGWSGPHQGVVQPIGTERTLDKRVITEWDIKEAVAAGAAVLRVGKGAILTDLARERARDQKLEIVRG